ncbi:hypothetical protein EVAR_69502_1 [Eumeta japonica]|uniref:Uncharacterized protein n=1 Tax=Eumeta variegata TaxID=151549 RepID=A0A4C2AE10_EUMVA|nr:hypothetical protein EVAR_69502_1 [Eumeta japonica]
MKEMTVQRYRAQRTKFCLSELSANDARRRFNAPRPFLLRSRVPNLRHCNASVTNFTAAEFHRIEIEVGIEIGYDSWLLSKATAEPTPTRIAIEIGIRNNVEWDHEYDP